MTTRPITKNPKVTVVGSGFVGMSIAMLLSQHNNVVVLDVDPSRVDKINKRQPTIIDSEIEKFFRERELNLLATLDKKIAYEDSDFVVIATPTNYNPQTNQFDTSIASSVVKDALDYSGSPLVIIKSTVPVGYTESLQRLHNNKKIVFSPEFLREGYALKDNLNPSRIVMGCSEEIGMSFVRLLIDGAERRDIRLLFMTPSEAESVKLFANAYLAMRVSFFNELDSFAMANKFSSENIIEGVCLDGRIGEGYNNPSFGYGGYCLPKDTKQLLANYVEVPNTLMKAIVSSNQTRKEYIAERIKALKPRVVGIYRLVMKQGSNNFKESAVQEIMKQIKAGGIEVIVYEPEIKDGNFREFKVINELNRFKLLSDVILANRMSDDLFDVEQKVFTRDISGRD